jgi:hypothetical protein
VAILSLACAFQHVASCLKVFFTIVCTVYYSTNDGNVFFFVKENLQSTGNGHNPPHFMWTGMTTADFIAAYSEVLGK